MIVLMAGLPGTGKSTLARELSLRTDGRVIGKDEIRHALFTADEIEYSSEQDDFCLHVMLETAGFLLEKNPSRIIFLDGRPFSRRYQIDNVLNAVASMRQTCRIIECICPEELARERIEKQSALKTHAAANRDFDLYLRVKSRFEAITHPKTVIDTAQSLEMCIHQACGSMLI
jgi:predicted kinase